MKRCDSALVETPLVPITFELDDRLPRIQLDHLAVQRIDTHDIAAIDGQLVADGRGRDGRLVAAILPGRRRPA
jgi:hypothetical protein